MTTVPHQVWANAVASCVARVPDEQLAHVARVLRNASLVVLAGNGGSASLASHMAQALLKPGYAAGGGVASVALTDGVPTLTAHANDGGWAAALEKAARPFLTIPESILVLFSSSGRSENVCRVARLGRALDRHVIAFTGFAGEPLRSLATVSLHVDSDDYEVVEPVHDALLHRVQYHFRLLSA